jgi:hypothetical protein
VRVGVLRSGAVNAEGVEATDAALCGGGTHRDAVVLVDAQALSLRVGEADLAVAPFTTDGYLAADPAMLAATPPLELALMNAGFYPKTKDSVGVCLLTLHTAKETNVHLARRTSAALAGA